MFQAKMNTSTNELVKYQNNPYIYPNKYHPNQKGHQLIAEELYEFLK
jgi:lysophospholipase L1-like esterase